jgi:gp32 DNA binding protein like
MALNRNKEKSRFVYQDRDDEEVRKISHESGRKYETPFKQGFDVFTPKPGTNNIRILPPTWPNAKYYAYFIYVHRFVGASSSTFLCLQEMGRGKCPCCEAWKQAKESGDEQEARAMAYSVQAVYWILNRDGDGDTPQLYTISKVRDSEIVELSEDPQTHKLLRIDHPDEGYDISFKRTGKGKTDTKYIGTRVARSPSPIHENEDTQATILEYISKNPIPSVLLFRDYKYINDAISGTAQEKDEDLDAPEENEKNTYYDATEEDEPLEDRIKPAPKTRQPRDEDEKEEEDEEPEKEEMPSSTRERAYRQGKQPRPKDEDEDELPAPRKPARTERVGRR